LSSCCSAQRERKGIRCGEGKTSSRPSPNGASKLFWWAVIGKRETGKGEERREKEDPAIRTFFPHLLGPTWMKGKGNLIRKGEEGIRKSPIFPLSTNLSSLQGAIEKWGKNPEGKFGPTYLYNTRGFEPHPERSLSKKEKKRESGVPPQKAFLLPPAAGGQKGRTKGKKKKKKGPSAWFCLLSIDFQQRSEREKGGRGRVAVYFSFSKEKKEEEEVGWAG